MSAVTLSGSEKPQTLENASSEGSHAGDDELLHLLRPRIDIRMIICIIGHVRFTWHEPKRQITLQKRGLDFAHAEQVFAGPTFTFEDEREDYGERRWVTLGVLQGKVVMIVHTENEDEIRVIYMREANKDEQFLFFSNL